MLHIGSHLSSSKGYRHMGEEALLLGADTFQFFTRNPRGSKAKSVDPGDAAALRRLAEEKNFAPLLAHAPYTLNACAAAEEMRAFALSIMREDLAVLETHVPQAMYNFHPGNHVGQGSEAGIGHIVHLLNALLREGRSTVILLETMSGKGTEIGWRFEELAEIIGSLDDAARVGVCLDPCHVHAAGYDIVNDLDGVLREFDSRIGLGRLRAVHLNDSMMPFASRKDRHARIGEGSIGLEAITRIINHPALRSLPFYLETPNEQPGYAQEIALLRAAFHD